MNFKVVDETSNIYAGYLDKYNVFVAFFKREQVSPEKNTTDNVKSDPVYKYVQVTDDQLITYNGNEYYPTTLRLVISMNQ